MEILGRIQNGVVVLEGESALPEGTLVTVSCKAVPGARPVQAKRIEFPLVRSRHPGSVQLTAEKVAAYLEEEDVPS